MTAQPWSLKTTFTSIGYVFLHIFWRGPIKQSPCSKHKRGIDADKQSPTSTETESFSLYAVDTCAASAIPRSACAAI